MNTPSGPRADRDRRRGQPSLATTMKVRRGLQSGKHGNSVSLDGHYGQVERDHVISKNPRTAAQVRVRTSLSRASARWGKITEAQRQAWWASATEVHSDPNLGQSGTLTGCAHFVQINCNLASINLPMVDDPPPRPQFGPNPVAELCITSEDGDIRIKLRISGPLAQHTIVLGAAPVSAGVYYIDHFAILSLLPPPKDGFSDITDMYEAKYGKPSAESKIAILIKQQIDGWEDQPKEVRAIVPAA